MQITEHIHALRIPFSVPTPSGPLPRFVYCYLVVAPNEMVLIDSGVAGAEHAILGYIAELGRDPRMLRRLVLTHAHPDHIGSAAAVVAATGCRVLAHPLERTHIEDVARQARERPVPGFETLVSGAVRVDDLIEDGARLELGARMVMEVLHTPGHSPGSLSLWYPSERALLCADAVPLRADLPIWDNARAARASVVRLRACAPEILLSAWDAPQRGPGALTRLHEAIAWIDEVTAVAIELAGHGTTEPMALCRAAVARLGLPPAAANPLVARTLLSSQSMMSPPGH